MAGIGPIVALVIFNCIIGHAYSAPYLGKLIGKLSELHHGVSGEIYAVDGRTIHIKDYTYDGQGPAAYFYANTAKVADKTGFRLRDENGNGEVIRRYRKEGVTLTLPEGKTLRDIKIFYVWCEEFDVNFGDVKIPRNFDFPRPQKIDPLKGVHAISSDNIVIVDAQTLLIPNLSYDGEAPDAKFWVGRGPKPSPQGIRVPDENGKEVPLRRYDRKTVVLTLPGDLTVFDIGHFGIWCEAFTVDFGHIQIPENLNIPPSLKMLGVSPQKRQQLTYDISSEVSAAPRQRVGGNLQPTTYRPPRQFDINQRRADLAQPQQQLAQQISFPHAQPTNFLQQQNFIPNYQQQIQQNFVQQQGGYIPLNQHNFIQAQQQLQQQQNFNQQQLLQQQNFQQQPVHQRLDQVPQQNFYQPQQIQQRIGYQPLDVQQRQYQQQLAYNQILQNRRILEEQQLKAQLSRQHNRFDLSGNQNAYVPFG